MPPTPILGFILTLSFYVTVTSALLTQNEDPDFRPYLLSTCQRVWARGQICERRQVKTEDGYILALHRLHTKNLNYGPPVLVIHGLLSASDQWLLSGRDRDLPSILADKGYDVWLGDTRGNAYSRKHISLNPDSPEFWDFSFHEVGYYDIPAMVDYIRLQSGHKKVYYVGYSLGGTDFLVMASARPEYNKKIKAGILIAPYAYSPSNMNRVVQMLVSITTSVMRRWRMLRVFEVFPRSNATLVMNHLLCMPKSSLMPLCLQVYNQIFGLTEELNEDHLIDLMSTFRAGSSAKTLNHCMQVMHMDSLRYYDYDDAENLKRYGQTDPPEYNLSLITAPVSLHYSSQDWFVSTEKVERLTSKLPNVIGKYLVSSRSFNHMDFLVGIHARELVYEDVTNVISNLT
ncbi:lipase 1-like [Cimex lectularius]|uniref:Lipase n=1 Tax=Cimex lectularius TaxID=79782 RepID=A0A8I6RLX8_CIMLE|nr:lipase 1-like [Cimex lectularius]